MNEALKLIQKWEQSKQVKQPSIAEEFAPVFSEILLALAQIVSKEIPAPIVEVKSPEVKVELENPIEVIVPKQPKQEPPIVNIDSYDYSKMIIALKVSVDKLTEAVESRPKRWQAIRNGQGFIDYIDGVDKDDE